MDISRMVGAALVVAGFMDIFAVRFFIEPRLRESPEKERVTRILMVSGVGMALAGSVLLAGWVSLPL